MHLNRNSIYAVLALGGGFLGGIIATQLTPGVAGAARAMHVVRAEKFELVDTDGNRRASLEVTDNGVADLILFDGAGRDDAEYRVTRDGIATISFYDKAGDKRVLMGEVPGGRNGVTVYGPSDKLMAGLTVSPTNEASLTLYDPTSGRRVGRGDQRFAGARAVRPGRPGPRRAPRPRRRASGSGAGQRERQVHRRFA
jgi:hypothetical protein